MQATRLRAWLVLGYCLLIQILTVGIGTYSFAFFVLPWMHEFNAQRSELMLAMSGFSIVVAILSILCGPLIDRKSARTLVTIGVLAFAGGLFGIALAPTAQIVVILFAIVLPLSLILSGPLMAQTLVARHFTEKRGMALGICSLGTSFGGLIMAPLVTALLADYDWRTVLFMLGGAGLVLMIPPAWLLLQPQAGSGGGGHHGGNLLQLMRNPSVWLMALAYLGPASIFIALLHNIGAFAADLSVSQQQAGFVVSAASLMMIAAKFSVGALADRISHTLLYFVLLAMITLGILLIVVGGNGWALSVGVPIAALSMGMMPLIAAMIARRFGPESFGSVMGVVLAIASLSGLAPAAAGLLREISGSYASAFTYLLALLIPAALSFIALTQLPLARPQPAAS